MLKLLLFVALIAQICHSQILPQTLNLYNNNLFVRIINDGQYTQFYVTSPLGNGVNPNDAWLALGLNNEPAMRNTNAVICRYSTSTQFVQHYYNPIYLIPQLVATSNPSIGITGASVSVSNGNLTCTFTRANQVSGQSNYYQLTSTSQPYLVTAFGTGNINYHGSNKQVSQNRLSFGTSSATTQSPDSNNQNNLFTQLLQFLQYVYNLIFKRP